MSTNANDTSDIQRQMALIRRDMHQEVEGAVRGAQLLTDWRSLVKTYPWASLGVAAAVGYLIVPSSRSTSRTFVTLGTESPEVLEAHRAAGQAPRPPRTRGKALGFVFSMLAPVAARAAQNYALGYLEQWLSQGPFSPSSATRPPAGPERAAGRAVPPGSSHRLREFG